MLLKSGVASGHDGPGAGVLDGNVKAAIEPMDLDLRQARLAGVLLDQAVALHDDERQGRDRDLFGDVGSSLLGLRRAGQARKQRGLRCGEHPPPGPAIR